jgi:hypothetical protein
MTEFAVTAQILMTDWVDVTRLEGDDPNDDNRLLEVQITRGAGDEDTSVVPTEVRIVYYDPDCVIDGENPHSPYYRLIVQGTLLRVQVDGETRALVEIYSLVNSWSSGHNKVVTEILGADQMRQLSRSEQPLESPAYRTLSSPENAATRIVYLPLEEEEDATRLSVFGNVSYATVTGEVTLGGDSSSRSSARLVQLGENGKIYLRVPDYTATQHKTVATWKIPSGGLADNSILYEFRTQGNVDRIWLRWGTGNGLQLQAFLGNVLIDQTGTYSFGPYIGEGQEFLLSLEWAQDGADLDTRMFAIGEVGGATLADETLTNVRVDRITSVRIGHTDIAGCSVGHLIVGNETTAFPNYISGSNGTSAVKGYAGEPASSRITRVGTEIFAFISSIGNDHDTQLLGVQGQDTTFSVWEKAAGTDMGILYPARDSQDTVYRTRASLYNQVPTAVLDYSHLTPPLTPAVDDNRLVNQVTATRSGGSSVTYTIPDGDPWHRTTEYPPEGVGPRPASISPDVESDDQLNELAAWYAHVRSWKGKRITQVTIDLGRPEFDADAREQVRALDLGDVMTVDVTGSPRSIAENELRMMVRGYTETPSRFQHEFVFNTVPADPYEVEVTDPGAAELTVPIDTDDTELRLVVTAGPLFSVTDVPYHVQIAGEAMTVTEMETPSGVTYVGAGTVASADGGNNVTPAHPASLAVGDLKILWAATRNSAAGTVDSLTAQGWTTFTDGQHGNCRLFYRYHQTGDTAPTVAFSGDVAGDTNLAVIIAWRDVAHSFASGTTFAPKLYKQLNASAQNIAYPLSQKNYGGISLIFAWKQDDWTGVAPPAGWTEAVDSSSTTGNDAGIWIGYDDSADLSAGSLVVTGGAAAISRSVVLSLRTVQIATVTRAVNGVNVSGAVGNTIRSWRPGYTAL